MACLLAFAALDYHLPLSLYIIQRLWSRSRRKGCFGQRLLATVPRQNRGDDERWPAYYFNGNHPKSRGINLFATCKVLSNAFVKFHTLAKLRYRDARRETRFSFSFVQFHRNARCSITIVTTGHDFICSMME